MRKLFVYFVVFLVSCSGVTSEKKKTSVVSSDLSSSIWVMKSDGSMTCQKSDVGVVSIETARKQLEEEGVTVLVGKKGSRSKPGMVKMLVCNIPTDHVNCFQIPGADLKKAQAAGFDLAPDFVVQKLGVN